VRWLGLPAPPCPFPKRLKHDVKHRDLEDSDGARGLVRELAVLLASNSAGHEDPQVSHVFVDRVHDGLPVRADVIDVVIKVENPSERLPGRRDVAALRAEHHDRRSTFAQGGGRKAQLAI
jgi:hypothetical protein